MKKCRRVVLAGLCCSTVVFAAQPSAPPAAAPAPKATAAEYPLSCAPAVKPVFNKANDALANLRVEETRTLLRQVLAQDPACVLAKAFLGQMTPGAEGRAMVTEALGKTAGLTEVEKLVLQSIDATTRGDSEQAFKLTQKARDLAPNVYELNLDVSYEAYNLEHWDVAMAAARHATELKPKGGPGWNMLGLAYSMQNDAPNAVAALRKYVEVAPTEANAHDSLGEALLNNEQLDEAAAEFQKAIDTSKGTFWTAWHGLATVKALRADWDGARADLTKCMAAAETPADKAGLIYWVATTWFAQGNLSETNKSLDAFEKDSAAAKADFVVAMLPTIRGDAMVFSGKPADALKHYAAAEKVKTDGFTVGQRRALEARRLRGVVLAQAALGRTAEAEKGLAPLDAVFKETPATPEARDTMALARGTVALNKKDARAAVTAFSGCTQMNFICHLKLAEAQDATGDTAAATVTRTAILKANRRDPDYWWVRAQALVAQKAPGKKVAAEGAKK